MDEGIHSYANFRAYFWELQAASISHFDHLWRSSRWHHKEVSEVLTISDASWKTLLAVFRPLVFVYAFFGIAFPWHTCISKFQHDYLGSQTLLVVFPPSHSLREQEPHWGWHLVQTHEQRPSLWSLLFLPFFFWDFQIKITDPTCCAYPVVRMQVISWDNRYETE